MKTLLITGGTGFVGGHVVAKLRALGYGTRCLVRDPAKAEALEKTGAEIILGDIANAAALASALDGVFAVINCAGVLRSRDVSRYYAVNRDAAALLSRLASERGVKIIHVSSLAARGPSLPRRPRKLSDEPSPVSDYGKSKLEGENIIKKTAGRWTVIVPSAVYGPRDKDMFAFFKMVSFGIGVATFRARALNLTYVEDVAAVCAVCADNTASDGKTYYVADPAEYSWRDVCETIARAAHKKILNIPVPDFVLRAAAFVSEQACALAGRDATFNSQKAREMLQSAWTCADAPVAERDLGVKFTDFASGSAKTYNWYKANGWV